MYSSMVQQFYVYYGLSCILLTLCNKYLSKRCDISMLLITQNLFSALFIIIGFLWNRGKNNYKGFFQLQPLQWNHVVYLLPLMISFTGMLYSSLMALGNVSIATVVVFRNMGTLFVAFGDIVVFGKRISKESFLCLMIIVGGAFVFRMGDHSNEYLWIGINTSFVVINAIIEKFVSVKISQTSVGISLYLNLSSFFILAIVKLFESGELSFMKSPDILDFTVYLLSCCLAMTIGASYFSLNKVAPATSIKVVNNMARLVTVFVSHYALEDSSFQKHTIIGLSICMIGGLLFGLEQLSKGSAIDRVLRFLTNRILGRRKGNERNDHVLLI